MDNIQIVSDVLAEVGKARKHFPSNKYLLHAFVEEAGEVTKAFMDCKQKGASPDDVRKELVQTIAMAWRLLQEGDPDFPEFKP